MLPYFSFNVLRLAVFVPSLLVCDLLFGQCDFISNVSPLNVINPSFDGPKKAHHTPDPWSTCGITPDTQPGSWGITLPPSDGSSYVGFVQGGPTWLEGASQKLSGPMIAGQEYSFTVDLAISPPGAGGGIVTAPSLLVIHGAMNICQRTELLWTSPLVSNSSSWKTFEVTFTPTQNWTHIFFSIPLNAPYLSYIMLDNITPIVPKQPTVSFTSHIEGSQDKCFINLSGSISEEISDSIIISGNFINSPTQATLNGKNWTKSVQFQNGGQQTITATWYFKHPKTGDPCWVSKDITINVQMPIPAFTTNNHCFGINSSFNNTSTVFGDNNNIATSQWEFGDGNTSTQFSPIHLYATHGTKNVKLSVTDQAGCTSSITKPITIFPLPTATINQNVSVCQDDPAPTIIFNGSNGTPNYTFTYSINNVNK